MKAADADDGIGCIVITGTGERAFSAGGDIHEQLSDDAKYSDEEMDAKRDNKRRYEISASAKPTIGMMNGLAYGGAAVLASSLDMRIGCEGTRFRFLAAAYGRINSTWTLPNQVGWPIAKELLFSARFVEAEEAYRIGLLNHLVPRAQLRDKTMELAKQIAKNHRGAVVGIKALMLQADDAGTWKNSTTPSTNTPRTCCAARRRRTRSPSSSRGKDWPPARRLPNPRRRTALRRSATRSSIASRTSRSTGPRRATRSTRPCARA